MTRVSFDSLEELLKLPAKVQIDVVNHLVNYSEVSVSREYGRYTCFNGSCLSNHYAPDHRVWFFHKSTVRQHELLGALLEYEEKKERDWEFEHRNEINWESLNN